MAKKTPVFKEHYRQATNIEIRHNNKYLKASREQLVGMYVAGKMEPATAKGLFTPESLAPEVVAPATNATEKAAEKK